VNLKGIPIKLKLLDQRNLYINMSMNQLIASNKYNTIVFKGNICVGNWKKIENYTQLIYEILSVEEIKKQNKIIYDVYFFNEINLKIEVEKTENINFLNRLNILAVSGSQIHYFDHSENTFVNDVLTLFDNQLLNKEIVNVFVSKYDYDKILFKSIVKNKITFIHYNYGFQNTLYYSISINDFFMLDFKNLPKYFKNYFKEITKIDLENISEKKLKYKLNEFIYNHHKKEFKKTDEYYKKQIEIEKQNQIIINKHLKKSYNQKTYLMKNKLNGLYKIGKSINPKYREKTLQSQEPEIEMVKVWQKDIENDLHFKYKKYRKRGEWFKLNKTQVKHICTKY